jgi:hypothetical protein
MVRTIATYTKKGTGEKSFDWQVQSSTLGGE